MYYYETSPIDFWAGTMTRAQLVSAITAARECFVDEDHLRSHIAEIDEMYKHARDKWTSMGWYGDVREGPFYFALPDPGGACMSVGVAVKQDNNGTIYIASPKPMPWLESNYR